MSRKREAEPEADADAEGHDPAPKRRAARMRQLLPEIDRLVRDLPEHPIAVDECADCYYWDPSLELDAPTPALALDLGPLGAGTPLKLIKMHLCPEKQLLSLWFPERGPDGAPCAAAADYPDGVTFRLELCATAWCAGTRAAPARSV
jgi:hypothetical protein